MKTSKHQPLIRMNLLTLIFVAAILSLSIRSSAQSGSKNALLQMIDDDRTTIDAIAGYDKNIQNHILQVAETPEVLNKMEELQKRSKNEFRTIIAGYDRDAQSALYELARYPNLITDLVSNGKPSKSEIERIVSNYPPDIHETAVNYGRKYFDVLLRTDQLNNEIDRAFKNSLEPYSPRTRESVNVLLGYPEIVSALADDKAFTALLGDAYRDDPDWVLSRLDQISRELAEQNKGDLDAYKNQIQKDPEAYNEMLDASEKFSRENNEVRYLDSSEPAVETRVISCYPFWFGYPYWYSDPYWRPRPLWYHTGFYRNYYGNIVFVGLPSNFFMHWHSYYHPTLFPHLSYNYYNFYENHYMKRYRESPRTFPQHGFYRSIEANVINNPRVNNYRLERIDHQRGNNIVRQPNTIESRSAGRGNTGISRQNVPSGSQRDAGRSNTINRRSYDGVIQRGTEGPVNRRGAEPRGSSVRREAAPETSSAGGISNERSRRRTTVNNNYNETSRSNGSNYSRPGENSGPSPSPQVRRESSAPNAQPSDRSNRRESRAIITQPATKGEVRENKSTPRSGTTKNSKRENSSGRER